MWVAITPKVVDVRLKQSMYASCVQVGVLKATKMLWIELFAQTNNLMAVERIDSAIVDSTLRSIMISPASLAKDVKGVPKKR